VGRYDQALELVPGGGRLIQTHEPSHGVSSTAVYLVQDVRSVVLTQYRHALRWGVRHDLDSHLKRFLAGNVNPFCFWGDHVDYWLDSELAEGGRLLLVKFEDLRLDTSGTLQKVLEFLGAGADAQPIEAAIRDNSLERMREKEDRASTKKTRNRGGVHRFVGAGSVGGWKERLSDQQLEVLEQAAGDSLTRLGYLQAGPAEC